MKKLLLLALALGTFSAQAAPGDLPPGKSFSFKGKDAIDLVRAGKTTSSVRLKNRIEAPYSYKKGLVLPIINSDKTQELRTEEEQAAKEAHGYVELTSPIDKKNISDLSPSDLAKLKEF